ncbi:MAG: DUF929 family protein [Acidimicrobiales bacterium]
METAQTSDASGDPASPDPEPVTTRARRVPMALVTWAFVLLVLLIVVVLLVVKITRGSTTLPPAPVTPAPAQVVHAATSVSASVFDEVGTPQAEPAPSVLSGQPPLVLGGRPGVVYVGGDFCPYCAAERWALVVALGRFGTFSGLASTSSSTFEVFPRTDTFSFQGSSYRSRYLSFSATEEYGESPSSDAPAGFPGLEKPTPLEQTLVKRYGDTSSGSSSGDSDAAATLPFVDVGNRLAITGAEVGFSPAVLQGDSMGQIAGDLSSATNPVTVAIVGAANEITSAICAVDGRDPKGVCQSTGVQAAAARLGLGA